MTFAERFSQLLQHLLRNLLQRRQSVWKALLWGAVTVVVIGFVAVLVPGGDPPPEVRPVTGLHGDKPDPRCPVHSGRKHRVSPILRGHPSLAPCARAPQHIVSR